MQLTSGFWSAFEKALDMGLYFQHHRVDLPSRHLPKIRALLDHLIHPFHHLYLITVNSKNNMLHGMDIKKLVKFIPKLLLYLSCIRQRLTLRF